MSKLLVTILIPFFFGFIVTGSSALYARQDMLFPSYGSGVVEVRIYSDYFCPPCRMMEPIVEPILEDLLKKNVIRLTLVDTPFHSYTPLYARYFLYALKENNDVMHAFRVRSILFAAAKEKSITTKEQIEAIYKENGISFAAFDAKAAFNSYSALLKEDNIKSTPTCVIIKNGQKQRFVGGPGIITALKSLQ
ncbi:MAG: thioredoxin domain-containing protein [Syntrophales bacterium]